MRQWLRRWWPALLLGVATIGAYGTAYYSLSVLIPAIYAAAGHRVADSGDCDHPAASWRSAESRRRRRFAGGGRP